MHDINIKIIIACHKVSELPGDTIYFPLHVGAKSKSDIGLMKDDQGDNISDKNAMYSELTGLYWAWKNLPCDYLGLVHYRRYLTLTHSPKGLSSVLTYSQVASLLQRYSIIVPKKRKYYIETLYQHYAHTFDGNHFDEVRAIMIQQCPNYIDAFDKIMKQRSGYMFNMFIMSHENVDAYCQWLFPILFELEKRIDTYMMTAFEKRYLGRVSERLWNVWLYHNFKKEEIKEVNYLYLTKVNYIEKAKHFLMAKFFHRKYDRSF